MAARSKKSNNSSLLALAVIALLVVGGYFVLSSRNTNTTVNPTNSPTSKTSAKPTAVKTQTAVAQAAVSGPVGRNGLRAYAGPGVGQVTLEWQRYAIDGENYTVHYGTVSGKYNYQADHIGYISTYTVKGLTPGTKYYFALEGFRSGNTSAGWDGEVSATAPASPVTVMTTAGPVGRNMLVAKAGPNKGQVTLNWVRFFPDTEKYSIVYGTLPGVYSYGFLNAKDTTPQDNNYSFVISSLTSGTRYYFALDPQRNGTGIYISSEVSIVAP